MDAPYSEKLRVWEGWRGPGRAVAAEAPLWPTARLPHSVSDQLFAREALNPRALRPGKDEGAEPYSLQWFLNVEHQRHGRRGRWLPRLLEFSKHAGETLLGMGEGLGTDWIQYTNHGAAVIVCSPSGEQLGLVRRNFELRGLRARFLHVQPESLPLENASIDVVCVSSLAAEPEAASEMVDEIYRVLKPGGKILALLPARYHAGYWSSLFFPWRAWTDGEALWPDPGQALYTTRELRRIFHRFVEPRVHKRHLRRRELPHLWRWAPLPLLERLMGRMLVFKAFKPLSAAIPMQAAA
jgi:SAM-dependent methyltransferase